MADPKSECEAVGRWDRQRPKLAATCQLLWSPSIGLDHSSRKGRPEFSISFGRRVEERQAGKAILVLRVSRS